MKAIIGHNAAITVVDSNFQESLDQEQLDKIINSKESETWNDEDWDKYEEYIINTGKETGKSGIEHIQGEYIDWNLYWDLEAKRIVNKAKKTEILPNKEYLNAYAEYMRNYDDNLGFYDNQMQTQDARQQQHYIDEAKRLEELIFQEKETGRKR